MRSDGVDTTDPHFDEWIRPAQVAARLGQWESVLRYYFRSFYRYGTIGTELFESRRYKIWSTMHTDTYQAIRDEEKANAGAHHTS